VDVVIPHAEVGIVINVDVAGRVCANAGRRIQLCHRGRAAIAAETRRTGARKGRNHAVSIHSSDPIVPLVSHIHVPGSVHRQGDDAVNHGLRSRAAIAAKTRLAVPGESRDRLGPGYRRQNHPGGEAKRLRHLTPSDVKTIKHNFARFSHLVADLAL
jgi:hypothetical protein